MLFRLSLLWIIGPAWAFSAPQVHTLDVGKNPESVTRGWNGDLFVTIMGERGDHPDADTDGAIHRVDATGHVSLFHRSDLQEPKGIVFNGYAFDPRLCQHWLRGWAFTRKIAGSLMQCSPQTRHVCNFWERFGGQTDLLAHGVAVESTGLLLVVCGTAHPVGGSKAQLKEPCFTERGFH